MLKDEELLLIKGGVTSTYLNSLARFIDTIYTIGQNLGSTLRRIFTKNVCKTG